MGNFGRYAFSLGAAVLIAGCGASSLPRATGDATSAMHPGEKLYVFVGGEARGSTGGFNGGGSAGANGTQQYGGHGGGGGGGSSYVEPSAIKSRMWTGWKAKGNGRVVFEWKTLTDGGQRT